MIYEISDNGNKNYRIRAASSPGRFSIRLDDRFDDATHEILITDKAHALRLAHALLSWSLEDQPNG